MKALGGEAASDVLAREAEEIRRSAEDAKKVSVGDYEIDRYLRERAFAIGQPHYHPARIVIALPLIALYEISDDDRQAIVLSVTVRK